MEIDDKTLLKLTISLNRIAGLANGCAIVFPDAAKAFGEIETMADKLIEELNKIGGQCNG